MKKNLFITVFIALSFFGNAQEPADALRYAWTIQSGTARQQAVGGAMGSLGGDISATFVNPAGLGFYKTGDLVFTPAYNLGNTKSSYLGRTEEKQKKNYFSMGTSGIVFGTGTNNKSKGIRGAAISIAVNRTANFGSNVLYFGQNNQSSYSQKFLEEIRNNNDKDANSVASNYAYGTSLAFNTYWIDTINGGSSNNYQFKTRAPIATGLLQQQEIINKGGITELGFGLGVNWGDKFYAGGSLGISFLDYSRTAIFDEADATSTVNNFDYANFTEELKSSGVGFLVRMGVIYKPVERLRLGLTFHTPGFYSLTDKYNSSVTANTETYQGLLTQTSASLTGEANSQFKYQLNTPYKIIGSVSYVLHEVENVKNQKGFLTADIEYINYKASSFQPVEADANSGSVVDYLHDLNKAIDKAYRGTFNFRAGGELKFTTVMVRLGGAYYGNPYKSIVGEKGSKIQASGGLGYRHKGFFIDLTYIHTFGKDVHTPYRLQSGFTPIARIKGNTGNALLTFGFKI